MNTASNDVRIVCASRLVRGRLQSAPPCARMAICTYTILNPQPPFLRYLL